MLSALKEMHVLNYVHRDVKPENYMVENHAVKIIDFGLSTCFIKDSGEHIAH